MQKKKGKTIALVLIHLVLLAGSVAQISTSFSTLVPRMCVLYNYFIAYFLAISRRISLV
jgi:Na+/alanine symporter